MLLAFLLAGCGSSGRAGAEDRDPNTVEARDLAGREAHRVEEMLRGQIAGVEVYETPSGLAIRIRGGTGFRESPPLFVIDGLPLRQTADGALEGLNPADIESIRVLKNVSETAAYGSRGANGVVLITTIRPPPSPPSNDPGDGERGR